ncbi:hypothetical protein ABIE33_006809 [Ensifer sp. 4252]
MQPGCYVNAVSKDVAVLHQNIADVDPDAEIHPPIVGERLVCLPNGLLDSHGGIECMDDRGEFGQDAVAGSPENLAMGFFDEPIDDGTMRRQRRQRLLFVSVH